MRSRGLSSSSSSSSLDASRAPSNAQSNAHDDASSEWSLRNAHAPSAPHTPLDRSEASSGDQSHVRIDARVRDKCPLCSEQAYYLVQSHRARAASIDPSARGRNDSLQKIDDKRMLIFQLEQILSIEEPDEIVFDTLLAVRRQLIERPLSLYNIAYAPWTLAEIERHFVECRIDALRRARRTAAMYERLERDAHAAAYNLDPATGAQVLDQHRALAATRIGDQRLKIEREVDRLKREREKEVRPFAHSFFTSSLFFAIIIIVVWLARGARAGHSRAIARTRTIGVARRGRSAGRRIAVTGWILTL